MPQWQLDLCKSFCAALIITRDGMSVACTESCRSLHESTLGGALEGGGAGAEGGGAGEGVGELAGLVSPPVTGAAAIRLGGDSVMPAAPHSYSVTLSLIAIRSRLLSAAHVMVPELSPMWPPQASHKAQSQRTCPGTEENEALESVP